MKLHYPSIIGVATSAVAVGVGIALLTATGFGPNSGVDSTWVMLNTSRAGQSVVQISQVPSNSGGADPNSLTGVLTGLLDGLIGNLTGAINGQLSDLQGELVRNLTRQVGLRDAYLLFVSHTCEGDFVNASDPNSAVNVTRCYSYKDRSEGLRRISTQIPSSFVVGSTNVSIPLVGVLGNTISSLVDLATQGSAFMQAMLVIGVVCTGLVLLGSVVFVAALQRRPVAVAHLVLALLGSAAFWAFAVAATALAYGGAGLINGGGGEALGVRARTSSRFVTMAWVAAVLSALAALHWWVVWFVEFRRHAYSKRRRTPQQVGNYRGILREVRADRALPREAEPAAKEEAAVAGLPAGGGRGGVI
ncbi:hypothetical protein RB595_003558 [Gaeumannomyces hyphopodioides]